MATTAEKLIDLAFDEDSKIQGIIVTRTADGFFINGNTYHTVEDAVEELNSKNEKGGINYGRTGFVFMSRPDGTKLPRVISSKAVKDRAGHLKLVQEARKKQLHLYFGTIVDHNGRKSLRLPLMLDWDCIEEEQTQKSVSATGLECPYCGKELHSTPGRTLHVKQKHPDKLDIYLKTLGR